MKVKLKSDFEHVRPLTRILVNYEAVCSPFVALSISSVSRNSSITAKAGRILLVARPREG